MKKISCKRKIKSAIENAIINMPFCKLIMLISFLVSLLVSHLEVQIAKTENKNIVVEEESLEYDNTGKMSLAQSRKILNSGNRFYTDEEILLIREWLYHMADIAIDELEMKKSKV
jgi:hypothetical protein